MMEINLNIKLIHDFNNNEGIAIRIVMLTARAIFKIYVDLLNSIIYYVAH